MKQTLLLTAAALTFAGVSAQSLNLSQKVKMAEKQQSADLNFTIQKESVAKVHKTTLMQPQAVMAKSSINTNMPKHTLANGVYYKQPAGTMYQASEANGMAYSADFLRFPAYFDVPFYDESKRPALSTWTLGSQDLTQYREEDGRTYLWSQQPLVYEENSFYSYPMLTLNNGRNTYALGDEHRNDPDATSSNDTRMTATSAIVPLTYFSNRNGQYNYYGWGGANGKHFLFGAGYRVDFDTQEIEYNEETGEMINYIGVEQDYPAPISPLYVESIDLPFYSFFVNPSEAIPEGAALTLCIYDEGSDEPFVTMQATSEDMLYWMDGEEPYAIHDDYGDVYMGSIHFAIKGEDAFGTATEEPFVLTNNFTVRIWGFENTEVGMGSCNNYAPDDLPGSGIIADDGHVYHYGSPLCFDLTFNGIFDTVRNAGDVETTTGETYPAYYVRVEEDGASSSNAIFSDLDGALFYTGSAWYTEDGDENYSAFEMPDWITSLEVVPYGDEPGEGEVESMYCVFFTAEPLPSDVTGRGYFVYLQGRGVYSELPIFVFQGDADAAWDEAIATENDPNASSIKVITMNGEKKSAKMFNLFGQQVSENFKGFVVVDGQKQIRF